ncbi:hypothetical protein F3Y22_tig00111769pilonHSYRG00723 [Hibiscus syriacus]|uniref:Uncharacterized protein n=1 Tax=Hibiscus syriacus TaxID=106335 RepID=A0A6A2Y1T0_HIBSY|nr:hypothetical protein F3Y22_tig00111769pilonHSYRG00723 [Hibiscus syriacus]
MDVESLVEMKTTGITRLHSIKQAILLFFNSKLTITASLSPLSPKSPLGCFPLNITASLSPCFPPCYFLLHYWNCLPFSIKHRQTRLWLHVHVCLCLIDYQGCFNSLSPLDQDLLDGTFEKRKLQRQERNGHSVSFVTITYINGEEAPTLGGAVDGKNRHQSHLVRQVYPFPRSIIVDFINSLCSANLKLPSASSWWKTTEKYKSGSSTLVVGKQVLLENLCCTDTDTRTDTGTGT